MKLLEIDRSLFPAGSRFVRDCEDSEMGVRGFAALQLVYLAYLRYDMHLRAVDKDSTVYKIFAKRRNAMVKVLNDTMFQQD